MSLPLRPERPDLAPLEALEQLLPPQHTASSAKPGSVHELLRAGLRRLAAHEGTPGHRAHPKDAPLTDGQAAERYVEACLRLLPAASAALNAAEAKRGAAVPVPILCLRAVEHAAQLVLSLGVYPLLACAAALTPQCAVPPALAEWELSVPPAPAPAAARELPEAAEARLRLLHARVLALSALWAGSVAHEVRSVASGARVLAAATAVALELLRGPASKALKPEAQALWALLRTAHPAQRRVTALLSLRSAAHAHGAPVSQALPLL